MSNYINCINRKCERRKNPEDHNACRECGTSILLNQRFRILERIGKSSYAYEVFRAEDTEDNNRIVAVKTLVDHSQRLYIKFFDREKSILKFSNYHCLPKFVDEGKDPSRKEVSYFVMEFIEGENLSQWLETHHKLSEEGQAWDWLASITKTLAYLHDRDRLHLDLKPDNIILKKNSDSDELVLIDFSTDGRVGTPGYIAPERESAQKNTPMVDFFALGKTFVHLTTGCHPETFRDGGNWAASTSFPSSPIIEVINWMKEEDPVKRPQTAYQVLYAIYDVLSKPNQSCENVKKLIEKISNPTQEDEELRSELQERLQKIKSLTILRRSTSDQLTTTINILTRFIRLYNAIARRFNRLRRITIRAFVGAILALIIGGLMSKYFLYIADQSHLTTEKQLSSTIEKLELQKNKIKSQLEITKSQLDDTKKIEDFISSGEKFMYVFGEAKGVSPEYEKIRKDAIENFLLGNEAEVNKKADYYKKAADYYKKAFEGFKNFYDHFGKSSVADPQIPIYLNNSKVRYLKNKYKIKTYTIAVVSPAQFETGQHILLGAALYQQQSVNNNSSTLEKNKIDERSNTDIYFEIKMADDRNSDTDTGIADKLAKDPNILAVVGPYSTEAIEVTLSTYANANPPLAVVSPTASKYGLTQDYKGKKYEKNVFFRIISSTETEAKAWVNLIKNQSLLKDKPNSIVALYKKDQNGKGFSQNIFNRFQKLTEKDNKDLHVIDDEKHVFDLSNITEKDLQYLSQIKDAVIILIPNGKSGKNSVYENALEVLSRLDPKNVSRIIASNPLFTVDDATTNDDESNENSVKTNKLGKWADNNKLNIAVDWHYGCNGSDRSKQYLQDFIGGALDRRTAASYEAIQVLSTLFKEGITRDLIITGLKNLKYQSPVASNMTTTQRIILKDNADSIVVTEAQGISFKDDGDRREVADRIMVRPVKTKDKKNVELITFQEIDGSTCPSKPPKN
jgi:serine/threonine protein kinase/ABC-type branched-subunit amino acid transport system substrate-binding protein